MDKLKRHARRKKSVRKKVSGTGEKPRMAIYRSNKSIYVQVIDDVIGKTICGVSSKDADSKAGEKNATRKNVTYAAELGNKIAKEAIEKGVKKVVFDRAGYKYHGTVKALADGARKAGLEF